MRYALDAALFDTIFAGALLLFQSPFHAFIAGAIIAGAGDTLVWSPPRKH